MSLRILSHRDYRTVLSAVEDVYKCRHVEQFPAHVLSTVKKAIPCDLVSCNYVNPERTSITSISVPVEITAGQRTQKILQQYLREHPVVDHYVRTGDGTSSRLSDFITQRHFHDLGLYYEFYKRLGIEY